MKVIFLDIDGVLNDEEFNILKNSNEKYKEYADKPYPLSEFDPRCVERLNNLVIQTGARIILSSSWRIDENKKLRNIFAQVGVPNFFDKTPVLFELNPITQKAKDFARGEEIQNYLDKHTYISKYVILDDDADMLENQKDYFVKCNAYYGFSEENLEQAIKILGTKEEDLREYWDNLKPFDVNNGRIDIPPFKDKKLYEDIIIKNLIRCGAIPKNKLIAGKTYIGSCRNASEATWNGEEFDYKRYKWGYWIDDTIKHFEDDMDFDVFVPLKVKEEN